jgi:hypothetical protein
MDKTHQDKTYRDKTYRPKTYRRQNISVTKHISDKTYRRQNILVTKLIGGQNVSATKRIGWLKKVINKVQTFLDNFSVKNP